MPTLSNFLTNTAQRQPANDDRAGRRVSRGRMERSRDRRLPGTGSAVQPHRLGSRRRTSGRAIDTARPPAGRPAAVPGMRGAGRQRSLHGGCAWPSTGCVTATTAVAEHIHDADHHKLFVLGVGAGCPTSACVRQIGVLD
jgi:hypothetical protein